MVIASFIIGSSLSLRDRAALSLGALPGVRVTSASEGIVVSAECADGELDALARRLAEADGVVSVSLVAAFREETPQEEP